MTRLVALTLCLVGVHHVAAAQPLGAAGRDLSQPVEVDRSVGYVVEEIRDGLYWVGDGIYQAMFLVTDAGVVLVDAPPTIGPNLPRAIASVTDRAVTHVVYSHSHTDHIGGASLFQGAVEIVAHRDVAEALRREADPRRPVPTIVFEGAYTLDVGGERLELDYRGPNHEPGNLFVYAPKHRVLMLVDVVYPGWQPFKDLGVVQNVAGYIEAHDQALAYDFDVFVGGHVDRLGTRETVGQARAFVIALRDAAGQALADTDYATEVARISAANGGEPTPWDIIDGYQDAVVSRCVEALAPEWRGQLLGFDIYVADNCWTMSESVSIDLGPASLGAE